jgi:hypothetical protein
VQAFFDALHVRKGPSLGTCYTLVGHIPEKFVEDVMNKKYF